MRYLTYNDDGDYPICFLVNEIRKEDIEKEYLTPFEVNKDGVLILSLFQAPGKKKTPVGAIKEYLNDELIPAMQDRGIQYVVVTDAEYFKVLSGQPKVDVNLGYVLPCVYGPWNVVYVPNYRAVFYDPDKVRAKIRQSMLALIDHATGSYEAPGTNIIDFEYYPQTLSEIEAALDKLLEMDCDLACDIEAFDLKHHKAGIGTISFAWNQHEGIAFAVDYEPIEGATEAPFGRNVYNHKVRELLFKFFVEYAKTKRKMRYHNISYDVYNLVYQLFMKDLLDTEGLLYGFEVMLSHWEDTKLITYLATNSCSGNKLGLKDQAQEFAGNYAESDIVDITKIPISKLLKYNLVDSCSTNFVYDKHYQTMVDDEQLEIYETLFKPAILDIIQMQLTGLPINMEEVKRVKAIMENDCNDALDRINGTKVIKEFSYRRIEKFVEEKNSTWKKKRTTISETIELSKTNDKLRKELAFNPNSSVQLQKLLFGMLELPVLGLTDSKQPSTDADTIKNLRNHTKDQDILDFLNALLDYASVYTILTSFIPAFENAALGPDGWHYLFGNFNLGGTVSGRLSSSNPNLQNLPASSKYAKLIKSCVQAPPGWVFCGLDFASLEDRISALTTRDPEKLKVYTDGFDGHCLRAYAYFYEEMPDIDPTSVESINSFSAKGHKYNHLRNLSKAPTFALTYQGTWATLVKNCGFPESVAKGIEANFKKLYSVSIEWVNKKLDQASKDGYITAAFGLRVRTPLLAQVIRGNSRTPKEAEAEGRTAGNALGQSWCLLNSRAGKEFMGKVRKGVFRLDIRPCAHIHDAQYYLVRDNLDALAYTNQHLVEAVNWNDLPEINHDRVGLGGELSIFHPNWATEIVIPNGASNDEILETVNIAMAA